MCKALQRREGVGQRVDLVSCVVDRPCHLCLRQSRYRVSMRGSGAEATRVMGEHNRLLFVT